MNKKEIAQAFSNGNFSSIYEFIDEAAVWMIVESETLKGKQAIISNCEQVINYFNTVTTKFITLNIIEDNNTVVINGTAEFLKNNETVSFVSACDIYQFNHNNIIKKITSYCIERPMNINNEDGYNVL